MPTYLLQVGKVEIERLRVRSIEINSTTTYRQSKISQLNLQQFLQSWAVEDILFTDITEEFGKSFKIFMKSTAQRKAGYINKCITWLNLLIYIAIDEEILRSNPLEEVKYEKKEPAKHRYISREELKKIIETPMTESRLELVRRAFIFSSLTGLAYVDIHRFYPHHIGKTSEGKLYIRKQRVKTNVEAFIPLHPVQKKFFHCII